MGSLANLRIPIAGLKPIAFKIRETPQTLLANLRIPIAGLKLYDASDDDEEYQARKPQNPDRGTET